MTPFELIIRWLRQREALVGGDNAGVRIELMPDDPLRGTLGQSFVLMQLPRDAAVPPGVEPVYPGSRLAELCVRDLEGVCGIAVVAGQPGANLVESTFIFSFQSVFRTALSFERLVRFALTAEGQETTIPTEQGNPPISAGDGKAWRSRVQELLPTASRIAYDRTLEQARPIEQNAVRDLCITARRLASFYGTYY